MTLPIRANLGKPPGADKVHCDRVEPPETESGAVDLHRCPLTAVSCKLGLATARIAHRVICELLPNLP